MVQSLHENQINGSYEAKESSEMIPVQGLSGEENLRHYGKYDEDDDLLYHLELHEIERSAIVDESESVSRYLATVFKERDAP